jgi:hypothetical protein
MIADKDKSILEMLSDLKTELFKAENRFYHTLHNAIRQIDTMSKCFSTSLKSEALSNDFEKIMTKRLKAVKIKPNITKKCGINIDSPVFKSVATAAVKRSPKFRGWEPRHGNQYDKACGTERVLSEDGKTFVYRKITNKNRKINRKIDSGLKLTADGKMYCHIRKNPITSLTKVKLLEKKR